METSILATAPVKINTELSAAVSYRLADGGKVQKCTDITVKAGGLVVAQKTLGGVWTQEQALREFRKCRGKGWNAGPGWLVYKSGLAA